MRDFNEWLSDLTENLQEPTTCDICEQPVEACECQCEAAPTIVGWLGPMVDEFHAQFGRPPTKLHLHPADYVAMRALSDCERYMEYPAVYAEMTKVMGMEIHVSWSLPHGSAIVISREGRFMVFSTDELRREP